ncbi:MAG: hypothetical protein E7166_04010 [Firmicutes bacterium]|nr:hypothetical protein [Bacillota bacterium]
MNKIEIKGYFKNDDTNTIINYDCHGEKNSNNISFKSENDILTIDIKKDEIIFKRENDDIVMIYNLILGKTTTNNSYKLKKENMEFNFEITTTRIIIEENKLNIEFELVNIDKNCKYQLNINYKVV